MSILSTKPGPAKALVVGISEFQDTSIATARFARRDAEEFAAFLQTVSGGSMERDQIVLLTDEKATLAGFAAALDWLLDDKPLPAKRLLYIAGVSQMIQPGQKHEDLLVFFHDSPPAPLAGNTFSLEDLRRLLEKQQAQINIPFTLIGVFHHAFESNNAWMTSGWKGEGKNRKSAYLKWRTVPFTDTAGTVTATHEKTISNDMVAGLLGLADRDDNLKVNGREIFRYLQGQPPGFTTPGELFYMVLSDKEATLSKVNEHVLDDLQQISPNDLFPAIVHLESMPVEDRVLQSAAPATRKLYEDFILAIKVKNFLTPPVHNAVAHYDSLLLFPELKPIAGYLRRRLAAAMLDDTQQALNAYLNTSANELARRRKNVDQYKLYAQLLGKADELLGEAHFMHSTLEAKRLYFEGLHFRLLYYAKKDSTLLLEALKKQLSALKSEPEAAYIYNELGVVYVNLNDTVEAEKKYLAATELSPTWGIPYANLCQLSLRAGNWQAANDYGVKAVALANWNPDVYATLAMVYHEKKEFDIAEQLYRRALRQGSVLPDVYYNLACIAAQKGEKTAALDWLSQAIEMGFYDAGKISIDPDLAAIRDEGRYITLIKQLTNTTGITDKKN